MKRRDHVRGRKYCVKCSLLVNISRLLDIYERTTVLCSFIFKKARMREKKYALYTVRLLLMIPHAVSGSDSFMKTILAMHHILDNEILAQNNSRDWINSWNQPVNSVKAITSTWNSQQGRCMSAVC